MNGRTKAPFQGPVCWLPHTRGTGGKCSTKPVCLLSDTHHVAGGREFPWKPSPAPAVLMDTEKNPESIFSKASFLQGCWSTVTTRQFLMVQRRLQPLFHHNFGNFWESVIDSFQKTKCLHFILKKNSQLYGLLDVPSFSFHFNSNRLQKGLLNASTHQPTFHS